MYAFLALSLSLPAPPTDPGLAARVALALASAAVRVAPTQVGPPDVVEPPSAHNGSRPGAAAGGRVVTFETKRPVLFPVIRRVLLLLLAPAGTRRAVPGVGSRIFNRGREC